MKYGIIAGNGRFPVLALETARKQGDEAVAYLRSTKKPSPEVERAAARCYWISLGDLSRLIDICKREGISADYDGGPGEACEDLFFDPAGLAAAEGAGRTAAARIPIR